NVCAVISRVKGLDDPASVLLAEIARDARLRERFRSARFAAPPVVLGPLAVDAAGAGMPGLLLAGDAAGLIGPMPGDGVRFPVRGGELAAEVALASFGGRVARPYAQLQRLRQREFGSKWRFNRTVRRLVDRSITVELAGVAALTAPWILRRAIRYAGDTP